MNNLVRKYLGDVEALVARIAVEPVALAIEALHEAYLADRQIFVMGNGGSAASASHFACDLAKWTIMPGRRRVRAFSLTDNVPLLTAWANDTNYTNVFGEMLENYMDKGDVLVGCTASGMSPNIINALQVAKDIGATTIALVGCNGGAVKDIAEVCLHIPSHNTTQIEDVQMLLFHLMASCLREKVALGSSEAA